MSLINRMLDDLATRQAPGAETLGGVRLADPLETANTALSVRRVLLLLALVIAAAGTVWWLWLKPAPLAPPAVRGLGVAAPGPLPDPAVPVAVDGTADTVAVAGPARDVAAAVAGTAPEAPRVTLRLDPRLDLPAPVNPAATRNDPPSAVRPPAPKPRPSAVRPAAPAVATAQHLPAATPMPASVAADPVPDVAQRARDALARGEPQAALDALGTAPEDPRTDRPALRAAALQRLGRHAEAASAYGELTRRDADQAAHWVGLAISLEALGQRAEATLAYRRALLDPRLVPSLRGFAQTRLTATEPE